MAEETQYWSYEQVLQELQVNRSQLNQLIREGRLREHVVEGETKFRLVEVQDVKKTLEKRPTVVEGGSGVEEPTTDMLDEGAAVPSAEPATEVLGDEAGPSGDQGTDLLEPAPAASVVERDTEILEEEAPIGEKLGLEPPTDSEELELAEPLAGTPAASDSALETELDLVAGGGEAAEEPGEEDFFDFSDSSDFELAEPGEPAADEEPELGLAEPMFEEDEDVVTDILDLGVEEEVPEEDLLSEIMDIAEEEGEAPGAEDTEDLTAEITTLEEPTYEDSELGEVLDVGDDFGIDEDEEAAVGFELPYAEPVPMAVGQVSGPWIAVLFVTVIVMVIALLFVVENAVNPDFSTGLTSWAMKLPGIAP